jgi:hypothetical protein
MKNEELSHRIKEEWNIPQAIKRNWIGHNLRRNCLLKHVVGEKIRGRIGMMGRRRRRRKQLQDGLKEKTGFWKLKDEALYRTLLSTRFGAGCGPIVRKAKGRMEVGSTRRLRVIVLSMKDKYDLPGFVIL